MNGASPELSIIISYYNTPDYLHACLASIERHPPSTAYEVIVVDDASPRPVQSTGASNVQILRLPSNRGFVGANNAGLAAAHGRFVLLLNCDTEVLPGALDCMLEYLRSHPEAAVVGPYLLNTDGSFQPQSKRGRLTPLTGLAYTLGLDRRFPHHPILAEYLMRYASPGEIQDVKAVSGSCMMVRRAAIDAVGPLDERLVMYAEDLDWCYRFGAAGWRVVYLPAAKVIHHGGQGGTQFRTFRSLYLYHRALWSVFRRQGGLWFPLYGWFIAILLLFRFTMTAVLMLVTGRRRVGTHKGSRPRRGVLDGSES